MSDPKSTLDKIQREIRENLRREDELKKGYMKFENGNINNNNNDSNISSLNGSDTEIKTNGFKPTSNGPFVNGALENENGSHEYGPVKPKVVSSKSVEIPKANGFRKFIPHTSSKGVMQKFIKNRGKLSLNSIKKSNETNDDWYMDAVFEPPKVNPEKGKPIRKGFITAGEKIERELSDFHQREQELRKIRRQSQPDLMAALEQEEAEEWKLGFRDYKTSNHTKSMANLYQVDDDTRSQDSSAPSSLKPARSLAELCDISDEETGSSKYLITFHCLNINLLNFGEITKTHLINLSNKKFSIYIYTYIK